MEVSLILPSGEQFEIKFGDQRAVVTEVGAGLRSYTVAGVDAIDGYGADDMCTAGRGQQLIPWPNRIEDGSYEFEGRQHQLPLNEPDRHNAIHGLVRWEGWNVTHRELHLVRLEHNIHPQPGYPYALSLSLEYALGHDGLSVTTSAANVGSHRCPVGFGAHPYITVGLPAIDDADLHVPATSVLVADERGIPCAVQAVAGTAFDFRTPVTIGSTVLDHAFTALERDEGGLARIRLSNPQSGTAVALWMDRNYGYVMIFSGDPLPEIARTSLAIEPMTCPPNAFRTGQDLISLAPGKTCSAVWGITPQVTA